MTPTWHADAATLERYADGDLDDVRAASLEAHLLTCGRCREELTPSVPLASLDRAWAGVIDAIDAPRPGVVEHALLGLGVPEHLARLLAATTSLRASWLVSEALALSFAVIAANGAAGRDADIAVFLFLVVAALLPVAGVAVAFGPGVDPIYELGTAAPMPGDRILLMRATAVLATSVSITALAALALPGLDAIAVAWLLPSLGLTLATLALGTWCRPVVAAATVVLTWIGLSAAAALGTQDRLAVFRPAGQAACLAAIVVSAVVLAHRHSVYEEGIVR
ncbi:MAG TPA: zf-HC2 domain-containing protein [Actinomycetota bacterium]|nr:zf-HC2 domain-containing protein [Actinomycetota bacterium]